MTKNESGKMTKTVLPENCPMCGKEMEKGYIRDLSGWWGWVKEEKHWTLGRCFEAYRCRNCGMILLSDDVVELEKKPTS